MIDVHIFLEVVVVGLVAGAAIVAIGAIAAITAARAAIARIDSDLKNRKF